MIFKTFSEKFRAWVRIASSVPSARDLFLFNKPLAKSTLEVMRTQARQATPLA
ncbi:MAG: hypothetical protein AB7U82_26095 [Blastocatellales bacterium]